MHICIYEHVHVHTLMHVCMCLQCCLLVAEQDRAEVARRAAREQAQVRVSMCDLVAGAC